MSERQYDGTPIDLTWNNGPWANDGETIDATDSQTGEIQTTMTTEQSEADASERNSKPAQVKYIRSKLLDGARTKDFKFSPHMVRNAAKGEGRFSDVECDIPPLEHTTGNRHGQYVIAEDENGKLPPARVDALRKQALNGKTATTLSNEYDIEYRRICKALKDNNMSDGTPTQPELKYRNNQVGWVTHDTPPKPTKEEKQESSSKSENTEDTTTTTTTEPPTYHPPERDSNRRLAYGVALVALVSYALGKLRGGA
jgi:hypothetical protein